MTKLSRNRKVAVIGGDERMIYCEKNFRNAGFDTALFGFDGCGEKAEDVSCRNAKNINEALDNAEIIVLPVPLSTDSVTLNMPLSDFVLTLPALFSVIDKNAVVFAGNVSPEVMRLAEKLNVKIIDYFEREELKIANAVLTAESAVEIAMSETDTSLSEMTALVVGYGRIGKALCRLLKSFGCNVYASARKDADKAWIRAFGYSPIDTGKIKEEIGRCELIFNTVPFMVLDKERLAGVRKDCLIIDLASKPGGVDFETARGEGLRVIWALALPGKKLKASAGRIICNTILNILDEVRC